MKSKLAAVIISVVVVTLVGIIGDYFELKKMSDEFNIMLAILCTWVAYDPKP